MARATTPRTSVRTTAITTAAKRPGRPVGSRNKASTTVKTSKASTTTGRASPKPSAASSTPKMSKADLQLHVAKLERSIVRLRKQNAELKQDAHSHVEKASPGKTAPKSVVVKPKRAAASKGRRQPARTSNQVSGPLDHDDDVVGRADA